MSRALCLQGKEDDLRRMFTLFTREGVALQERPMAEVFEVWVRAEGAKVLDARRAEVEALSRETPPGKESADSGGPTITAFLDLYAKGSFSLLVLLSSGFSLRFLLSSSFFSSVFLISHFFFL